jgi:uncharacterized protein (UPF0332 family)
MKARELIPVAEDLSKGKPPDQPRARSAVSRAYYAAFGEVSDYLKVRYYAPPPKKSQHDAAWNHLQSGIQDSDPRRQAQRALVADIGFRLKARRQKADYRLNSRLANDEANLAVTEAKKVIAELDSLDAALPPP